MPAGVTVTVTAEGVLSNGRLRVLVGIHGDTTRVTSYLRGEVLDKLGHMRRVLQPHLVAFSNPIWLTPTPLSERGVPGSGSRLWTSGGVVRR